MPTNQSINRSNQSIQIKKSPVLQWKYFPLLQNSRYVTTHYGAVLHIDLWHDYLNGERGSCLMNTHWNTVWAMGCASSTSNFTFSRSGVRTRTWKHGIVLTGIRTPDLENVKFEVELAQPIASYSAPMGGFIRQLALPRQDDHVQRCVSVFLSLLTITGRKQRIKGLSQDIDYKGMRLFPAAMEVHLGLANGLCVAKVGYGLQ